MDRTGCAHHRRSTAHVRGHSEWLVDFLSGGAQFDKRLPVKPDARLTARYNAQRQRNHFLCLHVERATGCSGMTSFAKALLDVRRTGRSAYAGEQTSSLNFHRLIARVTSSAKRPRIVQISVCDCFQIWAQSVSSNRKRPL